MIGRLVGVIAEQGDDGTVLIDVGGVGYEVLVPLGCLGRARRDDAGRTVLHVHTHTPRDEGVILFGFASVEDRLVFRTVIGVPNVGPKTALSILGALGGDGLARAIADKDLTRLTAISGVGKKTAERLVLELKDKLGAFGSTHPAAAPKSAGAVAASGKVEQLRGALANLGFRPIEVDRALEGVRDRVAAAELPELVREALALLRR